MPKKQKLIWQPHAKHPSLARAFGASKGFLNQENLKFLGHTTLDEARAIAKRQRRELETW
jgi:hypothetical protein